MRDPLCALCAWAYKSDLKYVTISTFHTYYITSNKMCFLGTLSPDFWIYTTKQLQFYCKSNKEHDKYFHETSPLKVSMAVSAKTVTSRKENR